MIRCVAGLFRGSSNTQLFVHQGKLLSYKEGSPPVAMNAWMLETTDELYRFGGGFNSETQRPV